MKKTDGSRHTIYYLSLGAKRILHKKTCLLLTVLIIVIEAVSVRLIDHWVTQTTTSIEAMNRKEWQLVVYIFVFVADLLFIYIVGKPKEAYMSEVRFMQVGFINSVGESPILVEAKTDKDNPKIKEFIFNSNGIPISEWNNNIDYIEAGLNITVIDVNYCEGKKLIKMRFVNALKDLPKRIEWDQNLLSDEDFTLRLGIGPDGLPHEINLNKIPMVLIGGATGSGKSVLLKLMLMQSLKKNAEIIISDFKGGVDFPKIWHKKCKMCFDEDSLIKILNELVDELNRRKIILKQSGYPNISIHNLNTVDHLRRIIFACDEIAEVLDTRGVSKEEKEKIAIIEGYLSTIARQGRAFGIHLMLATQRPDANIIPGQIKNNCQCKICGSCGQVLSQIVLDNTTASDSIPKDIPGRFMLYDGKIIQAYVFDEIKDMLT